MVVCISVAADDGAVVARSYAGYNNQKPSVASDNVYRPETFLGTTPSRR